MLHFYGLNRSNKLSLVQNFRKTDKDSILLLESFVKKFNKKGALWVQPKSDLNNKDGSLKIKSLKILTKKVFFLSKNYPLILKNNNVKTKVEIKNVKTFYVFSNFTKLQFSYYFFEKNLFEALTKLLTFFKENLPSKMTQNNLEDFNKECLPLFAFFKFLKSEKPFQYNIESLVTFSYLNIFLKERKLQPSALIKAKKNSSLLKQFLIKNFFESSNTILLFTFETMKKKSELSIQLSDLRKKKSYWLSLVKMFENHLFQNFYNTTSIFSILTMEKIHLSLKKPVFSNKKREEVLSSWGFLGSPSFRIRKKESKSSSNPEESYQTKKLKFYLYKINFYSLIDYFSYPLNSACYLFSDSNVIHLKGSNRAFQFLSHSDFAIEKNEKYFDFLVLFFGVYPRGLESRFDQFLLTKTFKHLNFEHFRTTSLNFINKHFFPESNSQSLFYFYKTLPLSETNLSFFDFGKIETFLFDKFKKYDLTKKLANDYRTPQTMNSLSNIFLAVKEFRFEKQAFFIQNQLYPKFKFLSSIFPEPHCFSLKLKRQVKFFSLLNSDFSNLWPLTKPRPNLDLSRLSSFQNWMKKNHLIFFKIQLFPTILSFQSIFSKNIDARSCETFHLFYYKNQSLMLQNYKASYLFYWNYNPFGFLTILSFQRTIYDYVNNLKRVIKQNSSITQTALINKLNSKILSYCYSNCFILNQKTFKQLDKELMKLLWKWSLRRHNNKSNEWVQNKYFFNLNRTTWIFGSNSSTSFPYSLRLKEEFENSNVQLIYLPYHHQLFNIFSVSLSG